MKKSILISCIVYCSSVIGQTCTALFSYGAQFEKVTFINQSNLLNARFYWNFGDGSSSGFKSPYHEFPETGNYLVTLFARDTLNNCHHYYETWLSLTKYSVDSCQTSVTDSLYLYNNKWALKAIDQSTLCHSYSADYDIGPASNTSMGGNSTPIQPEWGHAVFITRAQYYNYSPSPILKREAYKTSLYKYSNSHNYDSCSANFEFSVVSKNSSGQRFLFKAMNKNAFKYNWEIIGFGNPITSIHDTISHFYPYNSYDLWLVGLRISETNGCKDTIYQQLLNRNLTTITSIYKDSKNISFKIYPNPFKEKLNIEFIDLEMSKVKLNLINSLGQVVYSSEKIESKQEIDLSSFSKGIYFLQVQKDSEQKVFKVVKD